GDRWRCCGRSKVRTTNQPSFCRTHNDVCDTCLKTHIGEITAVWRELWEADHRPVACEIALIESVIIHHLYRVAHNTRDLGRSNSITSCKKLHHFIRKLVSYPPGLPAMTGGNKLLLRFYIIKICISGNRSARVLQITKGNIVGLNRVAAPLVKLQRGWIGDERLRIQASPYETRDSRELQIRP